MFGSGRLVSLSLKQLPFHTRRSLVTARRRLFATVAQAKDGAKKASFAARYPLMFGSVTTCIKTVSADLFVQKFIEDAEEFNWKRTAVFGVFGFFYMGVVQ